MKRSVSHLDLVVGAGRGTGDDRRVARGCADLDARRSRGVRVPAPGVVGPPPHPEVRQLATGLSDKEEEHHPWEQLLVLRYRPAKWLAQLDTAADDGALYDEGSLSAWYIERVARMVGKASHLAQGRTRQEHQLLLTQGPGSTPVPYARPPQPSSRCGHPQTVEDITVSGS